ncbi:DMT family transporter [Leucothrix mucor]|uniref:DMT family transporter n=1 Tax=Leucothrix mucor TaxID=45248 RepID=UPI0003B3658A|nr:DMT family transporter [Leucothrix mucor]
MNQSNGSPMLNWLMLLGLIMLWGTSFMFVSLSLESFSPVGVVAMRVSLGALVLTGFLWAKGLSFPRDLKSWSIFLLFGLLGNLLPFSFISFGQQSVTSGIAGLLMASMPLATMVLAHYLVPDESLNRYKILGFSFGILGVLIVMYPSLLGGHNTLFGIILILLASLSYALNSVLVRRLPRFNPVVAGAGMLITGSLIIVPIWLFRDMPWQQTYSQQAILSLIWLGIGPTGIATLLYFAVIGNAGPTFLSNINYVVPVVAYFTGALMLHEMIEWQSLAALGLIISGIAITRYMPKSRQAI